MTTYALNGLGRIGKLALKPLLERGAKIAWINDAVFIGFVMRDFLDTMRSSGVEMGGGPAAFSQRDKQTFANELDRFLTRFA